MATLPRTYVFRMVGAETTVTVSAEDLDEARKTARECLAYIGHMKAQIKLARIVRISAS